MDFKSFELKLTDVLKKNAQLEEEKRQKNNKEMFKLTNREATFVLAAMLNGIKIPKEIKELYWSITKYQGYIGSMKNKIIKALKLDKDVLESDYQVIREVKELGLDLFSLEAFLIYRYFKYNYNEISQQEFEKLVNELRVDANDPYSLISSWTFLISLIPKNQKEENSLYEEVIKGIVRLQKA